jgi:hypothetical protein
LQEQSGKFFGGPGEGEGGEHDQKGHQSGETHAANSPCHRERSEANSTTVRTGNEFASPR